MEALIDLRYVELMIKKYKLIIGVHDGKYWVGQHDTDYGETYLDLKYGIIDSHIEFIESDENLTVAIEKCIVKIEDYEHYRKNNNVTNND